jgi:HEAT repeat protein
MSKWERPMSRFGPACLCCLLLVLAALPLSPAAPLIEPEPTYHGKTLKQWIELSRDDDPKVRLRAVQHLGIGPFDKAAVPALRRALTDDRRAVGLAAIVALGKIGRDAAEAADDLNARLKEEDAEACAEICEALGKIGPTGVPGLVDALKDNSREVRRAAVYALGDIGPDAKAAVPALAAIFRHVDSQSPYNEAKQALIAIGEPAVPALIDALKDPSSDVRRWSLEALWSIGSPAKAAVPAILERTKEEDLRLTAIALLGSMGAEDSAVIDTLTAALADPNPEVRDAAAEALRNLGPAAKPALKPLVGALKDEYAHIDAAEALARLGEISLPELAAAAQQEKTARPALFGMLLMGKPGLAEYKKALANPNPRIRADCLRALRDAADSVITFCPDLSENRNQAIRILGPELPAILVKALKDDDEEVRRSAMWALGRFARDGATTFPALRDAMKDANPTVRRFALEAICASNVPDWKKAEVLAGALEDREVRGDAILRLNDMYREASGAVPGLVKLLEDMDQKPDVLVIQLLGRIGPDAKPAVAVLTKGLEHPEPGIRSRMAEALANIGPQAKDAVHSFEAALADEDDGVRVAAARALWFVQGDRSGAVPILAQALSIPPEGKGSNVAMSAAQALGEIGPAAKEAVPDLVKALGRDDYARGEAAQALGCIGPSAEAAIPALAAMMADPNIDDSGRAATALGRIGPTAIPTLTDALQSRNEQVRWGACHAFARLGPAAKPAVPLVAEALYDEYSFVRQEAAAALARIGPDAKAAVPALTEALRDRCEEVSQTAVQALANIGPAAKPAAPALAAILHAEREKVLAVRDRRSSRFAPDRRDFCFAIMETLGHLGPDAAEAAPELRAACTEADTLLRAKAAYTLWRVEGKTDTVLPVFKAALKDGNARAGIAAAQALWEVDHNKDGFSFLVAALQSGDASDRRAATKVLEHIGPNAKELVPTLLRLLKEKYAPWYEDVAEALKKIDAEAAAKASMH